jgi:hypothetical protein
MIHALRLIFCFAPILAFSAPVFLESQFELPPWLSHLSRGVAGTFRRQLRSRL